MTISHHRQDSQDDEQWPPGIERWALGAPEFPEGPKPTSHPFIRPGQVAPDRPARDACTQCRQPEAVHAGRPLTYNKAESAYRVHLTAARDRYAELSDRELSARTAALLRGAASSTRTTWATSWWRPASR